MRTMLDYLTQNEKEEMVLESTLDIAMKRGIYMYESTIKRNEISLKEAELKVMMESGSQEDLELLCEAATEEVSEKKRNILLKMIDAIKKFINSVGTKLKSIFTDKVLKEAQEAAKTAPKIEVNEDPKKIFSRLKSKLDDIFNVITHPSASAKSFKEWYEKEEAKHTPDEKQRKRNHIMISAGTIVAVAAVAAPLVLISIPKMLDKVQSGVKNNKNDDPDAADKIKAYQSACREIISFTNGIVDKSVSIAKSTGKAALGVPGHVANTAVYGATGSNRKIRAQISDKYIKGYDDGSKSGWADGYAKAEEHARTMKSMGIDKR